MGNHIHTNPHTHTTSTVGGGENEVAVITVQKEGSNGSLRMRELTRNKRVENSCFATEHDELSGYAVLVEP